MTKPSRISFAPLIPHTYKSCTLLKPEGKEKSLMFVSRPNNVYQQLFLATLLSRSIPDIQVLVKLVPRSYSQDVHKHMADTGLAPKLYGYTEVKGALTAYVSSTGWSGSGVGRSGVELLRNRWDLTTK